MSEKSGYFHHSCIICLFAVMVLSCAAAVCPASTTIFTLEDDNSSATFDLSSSGMYDWTVDYTDHLNQQWFWCRTSENAPEMSISTLTLDVAGTFDTNFNDLDETLYARYTGAGFNLELSFRLDGGADGSKASDVGEQISITNTGDSTLDFWFFQYVDLDLGGTAANDTAQMLNANTVEQTDASGFTASETVVTPAADRYDVLPFGSIMGSLNDASSTDLTNSPGPVTGDVTWAFQWDFQINPGSTVQISKDKRLAYMIPEPATLGVLALGLISTLLRRKRST